MADEAEAAAIPANSKYKPEYVDQARRLYRMGATDTEAGAFFEVDRGTIRDWRNTYDEFAAACEVGKGHPDQRVVSALYERCVGYRFTEQQAIKVRDQAKPGKFTERVEVVSVERELPPDTTAIIWWTKNRLGWRDKTEVEAGDNLAALIAKSLEPRG